MPIPEPQDVTATFCARLVAEWVGFGLRHAVIAPGSRSTPMALALAARDDLQVHVFHDERSAAFAALGIGLSSGLPAALLCTSGTAATHFHAAVVEADLAGVPMLVLTADRPPELHGIGAAQTIDQQHLYGSAARLFVDAGVPDWGGRVGWAALAAQTWRLDGPVHLNLPFREPLVGRVLTDDDLSRPIVGHPPVDQMAVAPGAAELDSLALLAGHQRGVIIAGRGPLDAQPVLALAEHLGWPVLADPRSRCRTGHPSVVAAFDVLLRHRPFAVDHMPTAVLHIGEPPASKVLGQWLAEAHAAGAVHVQVLDRAAVIDPLQLMSARLVAPIDEACLTACAMLPAAAPSPWMARWRHAAVAAERVIDRVVGDPSDGPSDTPLTEPGVARRISCFAGPVVVASSMPVRDIEWFGAPAQPALVLANRGANGIDGVVATAIGVGLDQRRPTVVLLGDVALCHDASSLTGLASRPVDLKIVVTDNDGGAIFSFLPQATQLDPDRFEQLFGTPHGTDFEAMAAAHHLPAVTVTTATELDDQLAMPGTRLIRVASDRAANVAVHGHVNAAVAEALSSRPAAGPPR